MNLTKSVTACAEARNTTSMPSLLPALLLASASAGVIGAPAPDGLGEVFGPRRVALLVGIDDYTDPALGSLQYAAKDAQDLERVLAGPGGFDDITTLTGRVSRADFWAAVDGLSGTLGRQDTLLIFIAAHGTLDFSPRGTQLYVLPSDGELAAPDEGGIDLSEVEAAIERLPARRRVLVLDTCHSGNGRSVLSEDTLATLSSFRGPIPPPSAAAVSRSDLRLYSAHLGQPAIEDKQLENGVYTHFFVQALQGSGDLDGDGLVEAVEAHDWARDETLRHTGGRQVPWMQAELVGREAVFLSGDSTDRTRAEQAILTSLSALPAQAELRVDGTPRGAGQIPTGWHELEVRIDGTVVVAQNVRIRSSRHLDVARLVDQRGDRWQVELGAGALGSDDWLPTGLLSLGVDHLPADRGRGRIALGATASLGWGDMNELPGMSELGRIPTGFAGARVGWWWGDDWMGGPTVSGGVVWRLHPEESQGAPAWVPGVAVFSPGRLRLGLHSEVVLYGSQDGPQRTPRAWASAGITW